MTTRPASPARQPRLPPTPPARRLLRTTAWGLGVVFAVAALAYVAGAHRLASPGPVMKGHAPVEQTCAACHEPWHGVTELRCERCHDTPGHGRFAAITHRQTARSPRQGDVPAVSCAGCHTEHRGAAAALSNPSTLGCRTCHDFTLASHPEFTPLTRPLSQTPPVGLIFSHSLHMPEERKTLDKGCEGCHERAADAALFAPISFDRHCAACHIKNGVLDQINVRTDRGHQDEATLARARALAGQLEPQAVSDERRQTEAALADVERRLDPPAGDAPQYRELDAEWARAGIPLVPAHATPADEQDRRALEDARQRLRDRLQALDAPVPSLPPVAPDEADAELTSLLAPCVKCHERDGARLRAVRGTRRLLTAASFSHVPHVTKLEQKCELCHERVERSTLATDRNVPPIARCQSCHGGTRAEAPTGCGSCHRFHRHPASGLAAWMPATAF